MRLDALNPVFASKITDDAVACAQSLGYSKQMIAWGFDHMFAHWAPTTWIDFLRGEIPALSPTHAKALCNADLPDEDRAQIWANTLGKNKRIYQRIVLVPASTVPSAVFQDICQILILPVALTLRPPRAHIDLYTTWKHHIDQYMPAFGARLVIAQSSHDDDDTRQLCRSHDAIVISGSDATIAHYRTLCANLDPSLRPHIVAHGHKISAICIDAPAFQRLDDDDFNHLAIDASVWDQTGCLSPKFAFVEANFDDACNFATKLSKALSAFGSQIPPTPPDINASAAKNSDLLMASLDGAFIARSIHGDAIAVYPPGAPFEPLLHQRLLQIYCTNSALNAALALAPRGQALATRSPLSTNEQIPLRNAGFNYFCTFGNMQDPPPTWLHDDIGTIRPLIASLPTQT